MSCYFPHSIELYFVKRVSTLLFNFLSFKAIQTSIPYFLNIFVVTNRVRYFYSVLSLVPTGLPELELAVLVSSVK